MTGLCFRFIESRGCLTLLVGPPRENCLHSEGEDWLGPADGLSALIREAYHTRPDWIVCAHASLN